MRSSPRARLFEELSHGQGHAKRLEGARGAFDGEFPEKAARIPSGSQEFLVILDNSYEFLVAPSES